nr:unnamed protein product [Callosobruchus chinensis]
MLTHLGSCCPQYLVYT